MKIKKWFVFAAMLVDRHRKENSGFNSMNYDGKFNESKYATIYTVSTQICVHITTKHGLIEPLFQL